MALLEETQQSLEAGTLATAPGSIYTHGFADGVGSVALASGHSDLTALTNLTVCIYAFG